MKAFDESINFMRSVAKRKGYPFCETHGVMVDPEEGCIFCNDGDPGISQTEKERGNNG